MGLKIDGRCHCGQITYEAEINPNSVVVCHCTDCQTFSSAPYRVSVPVLIERFTLHGEPRTYRKRGGSGREVVQNFCGACGTPIYSAPAEAGSSSICVSAPSVSGPRWRRSARASAARPCPGPSISTPWKSSPIPRRRCSLIFRRF
jgi:hypothetical protein